MPCAWIGFHEGATDKGFKDRLYTRFDFLMLRAADRIVVMSKKQKEIFPPRLDRVRVVNNAVPGMPRARDPASVLPVCGGGEAKVRCRSWAQSDGSAARRASTYFSMRLPGSRSGALPPEE